MLHTVTCSTLNVNDLHGAGHWSSMFESRLCIGFSKLATLVYFTESVEYILQSLFLDEIRELNMNA